MNIKQLIFPMTFSFLISGCIDFQQQDVDSLIQQSLVNAKQRARYMAKIEVPEVPKVTYKPYEGVAYRDPFIVSEKFNSLITDGPDNPLNIPNATLSTDPERPVGYVPEKLEAYELSALRMVGVVGTQNNALSALIALEDNEVIPVRIGDYMGKNFGKIVKIEETYIELAEKYVSNEEKGWEVVPQIVKLNVVKIQ